MFKRRSRQPEARQFQVRDIQTTLLRLLGPLRITINNVPRTSTFSVCIATPNML